MTKLIYTAITSLDGYVADANGNFDWAAPDDDVHAFVNELERPVGTYLYGRRLYEVMAAWETMDDPSPVMQDYARIWRSAEKIVYSTTLEDVSSARTRLERTFDPSAVRELKAGADRDSIGTGEDNMWMRATSSCAFNVSSRSSCAALRGESEAGHPRCSGAMTWSG